MKSEEKYDTIVVGGGIAGLTSTAYLSRAGQKVLLIEKNDECGGLVSTFKREGFHFEAGVRALEDAGIIFPMLDDLGIEMDFVKSPVSVGVADKIVHIKDISSLRDYREMLVHLYPESVTEIDHILKVIKRIMKHMEVLYGVENPAFKDLKRDRKYIFKQLLPWLPRFIFTVGKINRMNMPVEGYLKKLISNDSLRDIISQHFFKHTPTFFALSYFSLYMDYFYPKGGVGTLAESMVRKVTQLGGDIKLNTRITKISPQLNEVKDENGNAYQYENLVWAADLKTLYELIPEAELPEKIQSSYNSTKSKMLASRGSDSIFSLYLMIDEPLESFEKVAHGHFFYTPSRKGLGKTHREELDEMLNNWSDVSKEKLLEWLDRFTALNTYEISIPGLKDKSLVPEGKTGMIISFLAEYDLFAQLQKDGWYKEFRAELENRMIDTINESIYPGFKEKILGKFSFTPLSIQNRVGTSEGAIVGWTFDKPMPVEYKMQRSGKSVFTPIPNIFQAGQWAYSPAGVPMCILTGKLASDKVLKTSKNLN